MAKKKEQKAETKNIEWSTVKKHKAASPFFRRISAYRKSCSRRAIARQPDRAREMSGSYKDWRVERDADGINYTTVDVAIALDHLILAATSLGLGTCWIAAFNPIAAREVFGLPEGVEPVALTPLASYVK